MSQPKDKPCRLNDGKGLILLINPNGSKYWRINYSFQGKRKTISLGVYPDVSLKQARIDAESSQNQLSKGVKTGEHVSIADITQMRLYLSKFGLTPASHIKEKVDDPWADL